MQSIEHRVDIAAAAERVWHMLTEPAQMNAWSGVPEMNVKVTTDWVVGGPISLSAFHHVKLNSWGTVLHFEPPTLLRYTQLSSLSRLPDQPSSYSTTETIYKHLAFYWRGTVGLLKRRLEA